MFIGFIQQAANDSTKAMINKNSHLFQQLDPWGIGMTVIGYVVVFIALLFLYLTFANITKLLNLNVKRLLRKEGKNEEIKEVDKVTGEVNAAIAMALHLYYEEIHDHEKTVLTINKVSRTYSPWSSKIYGLRQYPR